jgi:hypothetical protein
MIINATADVWAERLPENCPPEDAREPQHEVFYRAVKKLPAIIEDFYSMRALAPQKKFKNRECISFACSIISSFQNCQQISLLPCHNGEIVISLTLPPESGVIKQTGPNNSHFSWWRKKAFNPLLFINEVQKE